MAKANPDTKAQRAASAVLVGVLAERASLTAKLDEINASLPPAARALSARLCYGVLRWHLRYAACLRELMSKSLRARDRDLECLLLCALYELDELASADYAVVDRSVEAARQLGKPWASGLVNAVLRRYLRERDSVHAAVDADDSVRFATPSWMLELLQQDWPHDWQQVCTASNQHPPMSLRVNRRQGTVADYLQQLDAVGIEAHAHPQCAEAIELQSACSVHELPGFADGLVSVQDAGAQLAAPLLAASAGDRVLDACAAPGGKTCHVLELQGELAQLVAVEIDPRRAERVSQNLERLQLQARLVVADAAEIASWWDGQCFDRILLDAPCSGSGVMRRHPDIKHLRRRSDIDALHERQHALLAALWSTLAPGGQLLYVTCSIFRLENDAVVAEFLTACPDARCEVLEASWGQPCRHGRQVLPGEQGMDGFYYARLVKQG